MRFIIASLLTVLVTSTAMAEGPEGGTPQQPIMQPAGQPQPAPQPQYQQQPPPQQQQRVTGTQGRGIEYGLHLMVPIWVNAEGVNPGFGLQGRIGWEFPGGFTPELAVGVMFNSYTDEVADLTGQDGFSNIWVSGGVRYMFFNPSAFVPLVGAGLQLNFWNICHDDGTGTSVCDESRAATLGLYGTVGAAYEISPFIAVEGGAQVNFTFPGEVFEEGEIYVSPFIGGTLYY